ncbi:YceI family protein [Marinilabilia salmonicolor]|jgi:polyisoprenoid-binding protein YceI|uniref:Polyisoprenoid-binding protein YceI n=1 Tax=Marinilabilia salmonicolor TaxID=989 RepID=A0A2T0XS46_9BACT|nr:YceI family protein [Marinilabilia salmonicolor]PRZ01763.1 polyisoprenoid-binding protein YceI [Marinilabilia salmonicolor]RCW31339.1 polyisoprenoid-binding protein YceI [Marinilabilia salmonicolor]
MKKLSTLILALGFLVMTPAAFGQKSELKVEDSQIVWTGKKVGGSHTGAIELLSGYLEKSGDSFVSGKFVADMTSISNHDIEDKDSKAQLVGHLKSDDFFSVDEYPTATLEIKNGEKVESGNYKFTGTMTIKGQTNPVSFEAKVEGKTFSGKLVVDRSKYNVRYGSGSFFDNLGDNLIYDDFELDFEVTFK